MLQRTYELDMVPGGIPLSIHLSQYDSDVTLIFQLYASQGILAIPNEGVTATIRGTKLDGNGISAEAVFSFVDSIPTVTVQVTKQMTAIAGKNTCCCKNFRAFFAAYILDECPSLFRMLSISSDGNRCNTTDSLLIAHAYVIRKRAYTPVEVRILNKHVNEPCAHLHHCRLLIVENA